MSPHKILKIARPHRQLQDTLSKELGISGILAQVLINRGINTPAKAERFLHVTISNFHDPFLFRQMPKAVARIKKARLDKERVMLFGDYDTDGVTSIALLKETLHKIGIESLHYLPHRVKEGYGLSKNITQLCRSQEIKLLITADCGTSNHKEIVELKRNGIDTIITDHHEPSCARLPAAEAIINPKEESSGYKYRELAGVGVAYKLCQALSGSQLLEELDLVSLGTIADSVPLTGENRIIAKEGLSRMAQTSRAGLRVLIDNAGIKNRKFNSTYVSFILSPRINASGRMDTAETSLKLLLSRTEEEAGRLAKVIEGHNRQRQKVENKILEEAQELIDRDFKFGEHKVIVVAKEDWHHGVLGIVASKLADRYYRPAIVISLNEELCRGSGRSIKSFHLLNALRGCRKFLNAFGGHSHAVGLVVTRDNINDFKESINRLAKEKLTLEDLLPSLEIDMELSLSELNEEAIRQLEALEPFGKGNPEPLFYTRNLKLKGQPQVLSRDTLKFWVTDTDNTYQAIGFGMGSFKSSLEAAECFDLVYSPRMDSWLGETSLLLEARDIIFR
ncbi:MAG: single-stranded-DNA-specific exonuclease RecJ [Candidatus Omnitrophica bacterium]|nr:single-stranded-DNA-specific exonuclease RecJ [Candidatus Omnitrophota bacterium]MBL7210338.1 single-stranded-DNA-specific exonuclease RecJ [Candidatus Omnitrophota bacterium]